MGKQKREKMKNGEAAATPTGFYELVGGSSGEHSSEENMCSLQVRGWRLLLLPVLAARLHQFDFHTFSTLLTYVNCNAKSPMATRQPLHCRLGN